MHRLLTRCYTETMRVLASTATVAIVLMAACKPGGECSDGDQLLGKSCQQSPVDAAMGTARSAATHAQLERNGDGLLARYDLMERGQVTAANQLLGAGAASKLREAIRTGGGYDVDHALVVYAWVLGKERDAGSLETLADFIEATSHGTSLHLAPHAATDAVFQILGDDGPRGETVLDFDLLLRDRAVAAARVAGTAKSPASTSGKSCQLRYTLVDANRNPIMIEKNGAMVEAAFECTQRDEWSMPPSLQASRIEDVNSGGGELVAEYDGGTPTMRYNCAGFSFREFTKGDSFQCNAGSVFDVLVKSGALRKKSGSPAVGDKVFYHQLGYAEWYHWSPSVSTQAIHVAVVQDVGGSKVRVRAPDNATGVFDADIDAPYFSSRNYVPEVYEWADGVPSVISTLGTAADPRYCSDECGSCADDEICLDGACVEKNEQTSCELRAPQCCPGQDNSCTAPDALCFCDDYCTVAGDCCPDACSTCGWCG